jgi:hypothetical protein
VGLWIEIFYKILGIIMIIKKITLSISLAMLLLPAKAEWTHVGTSGSSVLDFYVDYKNITVEGNYVKSKRLVDYHKEQKTEKGEIYWSAISIYTFDCVKRLQQVERFRYTDRMGGGARLENDFFKSEWENVAAGTPNDNYFIRACAFRS